MELIIQQYLFLIYLIPYAILAHESFSTWQASKNNPIWGTNYPLWGHLGWLMVKRGTLPGLFTSKWDRNLSGWNDILYDILCQSMSSICMRRYVYQQVPFPQVQALFTWQRNFYFQYQFSHLDWQNEGKGLSTYHSEQSQLEWYLWPSFFVIPINISSGL